MSLPPLTHTMLSAFANCPHKAFRQYIRKDLPREAKTAEQEAGIALHAAVEHRLKDGIKSDISAPYERFIAPLEAIGAMAEVKLAMTSNGQPAGFWENPWMRGVIDALVIRGPVALIWDWKTGKLREDPRELHSFAWLIKANWPSVTTVKGAYVWLKDGVMGPVYDLSNTDRVEAAIRLQASNMHSCLSAQNWPKTPNALCGWCPVKDCPHNPNK